MSKGQRVAVAISSVSSRTLLNLQEVQERMGLHYRISGVIASQGGTRGEELAKERGWGFFLGEFSKKAFAETSKELAVWLLEQRIDWIVLAGFLRKFPIVSGYESRIINIHPALLPLYGGQGMYGMNVHDAVWAAKAKVSGATVHLVTDEYDRGPILAQMKVDLEGVTSPADIAKRVFEVECELYPRTLDQLVQGSLLLSQDKEMNSWG